MTDTLDVNPLVSVVVAIYKSEIFLDKLIQSIIEQTYSNLEIILVDDGSPDNSGAICDRYAASDDRISVIHKLNGGACDARNAGIATAHGKYLTIIDGDDWLASDYIEYLISLIQQPGVNMSMTDSVFTTRDMMQTEGDKINVLTPEDAVAFILYVKTPIGPWNKMYDLSCIRANGLTFCTSWSGEGLYYSTMAAMYSCGVAVGHRRVYYYRLNNSQSGLTHYDVKMGINALNNIRRIREEITIRTPTTLNAADWHIWNNYNYLLFLIIATNSRELYASEYNECVSSIRALLPAVLAHSDVRFRAKVKMIIRGIAPVKMARWRLKRESAERERYNMI